MSSQVDELTQAVREVALQINAAQERAEDRDVVTAAHLAADSLSNRFKAFYETLPEGEKMKLDRTLGRRVQDIRRSASLLPRIGNIAASTPDRHPTNASNPSERHITGVSWGSEKVLSKGNGLRVGGEVESWCGPCAGLTDHTIVAMMGPVPKQVICQACNNRHGFRTTPARKAEPVASSDQEEFVPEYVPPVAKTEKKTVEQNALASLVAAAVEAGTIREFDPKERYKSGEIISHVTFGRGKIETVLRASLLVKFVNGGLKAVSLQ